MERVAKCLESKITDAAKAAELIKTGMTVGMSGFTLVGYPKLVPLELAETGRARELTLCIGASVGDELDGAMTRAEAVRRGLPIPLPDRLLHRRCNQQRGDGVNDHLAATNRGAPADKLVMGWPW